MATSERFFNSDEEREIIIEYLSKILTDLLSLYKRASEKEFDTPIHNLDFPDPIKKAIHVIHSNHNIPIEILTEDYRWLEEYLEIFEFPKIESHLIRISLEFGSWIVFFRDRSPEFLKPKIQKALKIWKGLFVDKSSEPDDILYLLIEMENLSKNITQPILDLWNSQFNYKPQLKPYSRLIAFAMNSNGRLGDDLFDGSVRLLDKRLEEMDLEEIIQEQNPLIQDANNYKNFLLEGIKSIKENYARTFQDDLSDRVFPTLLLISLIERFLKTEKQASSISRDDIIEGFLQSVKSMEVDENWEDVTNQFEQMMLESNVSDPVEMIKLIVEKIFQNQYSSPLVRRLNQEIEEMVEIETHKMYEDGETNLEIATILSIQKTLPSIVKKILQTEASLEIEKLVEKNERTAQLLMIFIDNINKLKRRSQESKVDQELLSIVKSLFNNAIINGIPQDLFVEHLKKILLEELGVEIEEELDSDIENNIEAVYTKLSSILSSETNNVITEME